MKRWPTKPLGEVCTVNPKLAASDAPGADAEVTFVPMAAVDEISGTIPRPEHRRYSEVAKGYTPFGENDVLFAKITPCMQNGKAAVASNLCNGFGFGSTEFHVLRSTGSVLPRWVFAFIRQPAFRSAAEASFTGSAGQQRVPADFLITFPIPVPPLAEQERIVKLLDEADELRKLRAQADRRTADLIPALFHEMFGDSIQKTSRLPILPLGEVVDLGSGATPSKENPDFWNGRTPWVSPKDMKAEEITGAEDHVSAEAFEKSNLQLIPKDTVLIVVRGMILAHTVPIRLCRVPVAINQDMKALLPKQPIEPEFLRWALQAQHPYMLNQVSTAGHGTKKLDSDRLREVPIPVPPLSLQKEFAARVSDIRAMQAEQTASRRRLDDLFHSMLHRAFQGEL